MEVLVTSQKPSNAALPVSPLVAVRITVLALSFSSCFAPVIRYGSKESATSLKAQVGP